MKHFKLSEFDSPDAEGSGKNMCPDFLVKLDFARSVADIPFKINSGYRTPSHNKKVGGKLTSAHIEIPCRACDIHCPDSRSRFHMIHALLAAGFTRIGVGETFLHVDDSPNKASKVIFDYY